MRRGISGWWVAAIFALAMAMQVWAQHHMTPAEKRAWLDAATWGTCAEYEQLKGK